MSPSSVCPNCNNFYKGLKKHYSSCSFKFDKLKNDLALFGPEQVFPSSVFNKQKRTKRMTKICKNCHKQYIFKHNCLKQKPDNFDELNNLFNFSDSYFSDQAIAGLKDLGFEFNLGIESDTFDFNNSQENEAEGAWINKIQKFYSDNPNKVKLLHLNINSIFCKMHEVHALLDKGFLDFIFIQETKLDPAFPDNFLNHRSYNLLRRDRKAKAGGLLIYSKKCYTVLDPIVDQFFETVTFSTMLNNRKHTFISSYNPHF